MKLVRESISNFERGQLIGVDGYKKYINLRDNVLYESKLIPALATAAILGLSSPSFSQESKSAIIIQNDNWTNLNTALFNEILNLVAPELGIDQNKVKIRICDMHFDKALTDGGYDAGARKINDSLYLINIDVNQTKFNIVKTYIHELVHIKQMIEKRLVKMPAYAWFEGKVIPYSVPYEQRKFEIEAHSIGDGLYYKYYKYLKNFKME